MSGAPSVGRTQHTDVRSIPSEVRRARRTKAPSFKKPAPSSSTSPGQSSRGEQQTQAPQPGTLPSRTGSMPLNRDAPAILPPSEVHNHGFERRAPAPVATFDGPNPMPSEPKSPSSPFYTRHTERGFGSHPAQSMSLSKGSQGGTPLVQSHPKRYLGSATVDSSFTFGGPSEVIDLTLEPSSGDSDLPDYEDEPSPAADNHTNPNSNRTWANVIPIALPVSPSARRSPVVYTNATFKVPHPTQTSSIPQLASMQPSDGSTLLSEGLSSFNVSPRGSPESSTIRAVNYSSKAMSPRHTDSVLTPATVDSAGLSDIQKHSRERRGRVLLNKHRMKDIDPDKWKEVRWLTVHDQENQIKEVAETMRNQRRAKRIQRAHSSFKEKRKRQNAARPESDGTQNVPAPIPPARLIPRQSVSIASMSPKVLLGGHANPADEPYAILGPPHTQNPEAQRSDFTSSAEASLSLEQNLQHSSNGYGPAQDLTSPRSLNTDAEPNPSRNSRVGRQTAVKMKGQRTDRGTPPRAMVTLETVNKPHQTRQKMNSARSAENNTQQQDENWMTLRKSVPFIPPPQMTSSPESLPSQPWICKIWPPVSTVCENNGIARATASTREPEDLSSEVSPSSAASTAIVVVPQNAEPPVVSRQHVFSSRDQQKALSRATTSTNCHEGLEQASVASGGGPVELTASTRPSLVPQQDRTSPALSGIMARYPSHGYRMVSLAERLRQARLLQFDSDALDLCIYSQPDAHWPKGLRLRIEAYHAVIPLPHWSQCSPHAKPYVHRMHPALSPADQAAKDADIAARGGRKYWFGRVAARSRYRVEKDRMTPAILRPRISFRARDISFLKEDELPHDVRESPGWMAYYKWHRKERLDAYAAVAAALAPRKQGRQRK